MTFVGGTLLVPDVIASTKVTRPLTEAMEVHMRLVCPVPNWVLEVGWPFESRYVTLFGAEWTKCGSW